MGSWFHFSTKGGIGGGGWVHLKGADSMAISGLHLAFAMTIASSLMGGCGLCPKMCKGMAVRALV